MEGCDNCGAFVCAGRCNEGLSRKASQKAGKEKGEDNARTHISCAVGAVGLRLWVPGGGIKDSWGLREFLLPTD